MNASYPECEKFAEAKEKMLLCAEFLDWVQRGRDGNYSLVEIDEEKELEDAKICLIPPEKLAYEFFGLDEKKLEKERTEMLEKQRKMNSY